MGKSQVFYLLSRNGKTLSNGCVLTWLTFILCCMFWVRRFFDPNASEVPESLQYSLYACLSYMLGGTLFYTGRNTATRFFDSRYNSPLGKPPKPSHDDDIEDAPRPFMEDRH